MLLADFLKQSTSRLTKLYGEQEARAIINLLCKARFGTSTYTHIVEPSYKVPEDTVSEELQRLEKGEPIQYVLGFAEFMGQRFRVEPGALIPRPETEILCCEAIKYAKLKTRTINILDLCTGSGCIAWSVATALPNSRVIGVDISEKALSIAQNQNFKIPNPPSFIKGNILTDNILEGHKFDLILSNPPYILTSDKARMQTNVTDYEPEIALYVPDNEPLIFCQAIADLSRRLLKQDGIGIMEIHEELGNQILNLFKNKNFENTEIIQDQFKKNRFIRYSRSSE